MHTIHTSHMCIPTHLTNLILDSSHLNTHPSIEVHTYAIPSTNPRHIWKHTHIPHILHTLSSHTHIPFTYTYTPHAHLYFTCYIHTTHTSPTTCMLFPNVLPINMPLLVESYLPQEASLNAITASLDQENPYRSSHHPHRSSLPVSASSSRRWAPGGLSMCFIGIFIPCFPSHHPPA